MKRILITGGAGFVGSHLSKRLLNEGHDVLCVDNYYTGNKENIAQLMENKNFEIYSISTTNYPIFYRDKGIKGYKEFFDLKYKRD